MRVKVVAGLGLFSVADAVRKNNVVARRIEKLAGTKKDICKLRREELLAGPTSSVKNEHCVGGVSRPILHRLAQRRVMKPQFRQRLAGTKLKVVNNEVAFGGCCGWLLRGARHGDPNHQRERRAERTFEVLKHVSPLRSENL